MNLIPKQDFYVPEKSESFQESIFASVMDQDDELVLDWALNVAQKAYDKGMVPVYIDRYKSEEISDDEDYVNFWSSITIVYAYITNISRIIGLENPVQEIMFKYLEQRAMFNCPSQLLEDLIHITEYYYSQINERGTVQLYKTKEEGKTVDGELLRIFCYSFLRKDEFQLILQEPYKTGWILNQSSPLYKGTGHFSMANKTDSLPLNTGTIIDDSGIDVIALEVDESITGTKMRLHAGLTYQVSFMAKKVGVGSEFSFGLKGFDLNGDELDFKSVVDNSDENFFFEEIELGTESYQKVTGFIYPYIIFQATQQTNLSVGQNLKSILNIRQFELNVVCTTGEVRFYDFNVSIASQQWNTCFIHATNFFSIFAVNRNGKLSKEEIYQAIRYYMLPYKSSLVVSFLENFDDPTVEPELDLNDVLLNKENEGIISGTKLMLYT
jgi:hypothetical protein